ncbi:hypothetical protein, partial [Actinocorallia lasiicapitis]
MIKRCGAFTGALLCLLLMAGPAAAAPARPMDPLLKICIGIDLWLIQLDVAILIGPGACAPEPAPQPAPPP